MQESKVYTISTVVKHSTENNTKHHYFNHLHQSEIMHVVLNFCLCEWSLRKKNAFSFPSVESLLFSSVDLTFWCYFFKEVSHNCWEHLKHRDCNIHTLAVKYYVLYLDQKSKPIWRNSKEISYLWILVLKTNLYSFDGRGLPTLKKSTLLKNLVILLLSLLLRGLSFNLLKTIS